MNLSRRGLFRFGLLAAPAIVAAPSLMRLSALVLPPAPAVATPWPLGMLTRDIILREALMHLDNQLILSKLVARDFEQPLAREFIEIRRPALRLSASTDSTIDSTHQNPPDARQSG
jgi:hypothetical protein